MARTPPGRPSVSLGRWLVPAVGAAGIALLAAIAFAPTRHAGFLQDDHPIVELNPVVHRGDWIEIFTTDYWAGVGGSEWSLYRPVTLLSLAIERGAQGRVVPARSHATNVLLHALAALLLAGLAWRLGSDPLTATLAGLLFAVHPVHVSAVAPLVGRADILATGLTLAALLCQSAAGPWDAPAGKRTLPGPVAARVASWSAGALIFLALGSKEVALGAPLLLLLLELLFRPRQGSRGGWILERAAALAPTALAVVAHGVLRTLAVEALGGAPGARLSENPLVGLEGSERLATAVGLLARYARLLVFPHPLSADYSGSVIEAETSWLAPRPLAGAAALLALLLALLAPLRGALARPPAPAARGDAARRVSFAAALFLVAYLPVGNLFVLVGIGFAERFAYMPSAGFCLLAALGGGAGFALQGLWDRLSGRPGPGPSRALAARWALGALGVAAIVGLGGVASVRASHDYRNEETIFEAALRATPRSPRAAFTLGKIRLEQGRHAEARRLFEQAIASWPTYSAAWFEKGILELRAGDYGAGARSLAESLRLNAWNGEARVNLAVALRVLGRRAEAEAELRKAARQFPSRPEPVAELGTLLFEDGRYAEATAMLERAVRLGRGDLEALLREAVARAGHRPDGSRDGTPR